MTARSWRRAASSSGRPHRGTFATDGFRIQSLRDLHRIVETDDDKRIDEFGRQAEQHEDSLLLRIEEFHLERHMIEARRGGEVVRELEIELQEPAC